MRSARVVSTAMRTTLACRAAARVDALDCPAPYELDLICEVPIETMVRTTTRAHPPRIRIGRKEESTIGQTPRWLAARSSLSVKTPCFVDRLARPLGSRHRHPESQRQLRMYSK